MGTLPTLAAHEEVVRLAERRVLRCAARRRALEVDEADALQSLQTAIQGRAAWIANNPDPQLMIL